MERSLGTVSYTHLTQARIDSGVQTIVGVNKYRLPKEDPIDILEIDNTAVRNEQIAALKELRANRDEAAVQKALADITECVKTKKGNLLELAVKACLLYTSVPSPGFLAMAPIPSFMKIGGTIFARWKYQGTWLAIHLK